MPSQGGLQKEMNLLSAGGSAIFSQRTGHLPGLRGRLNPIRDTSGRTCLYVDNIAIEDGRQQPVFFRLCKPMKLTDASGSELSVTMIDIVGQSALVECRSLKPQTRICSARLQRDRLVESDHDMVHPLGPAAEQVGGTAANQWCNFGPFSGIRITRTSLADCRKTGLTTGDFSMTTDDTAPLDPGDRRLAAELVRLVGIMRRLRDPQDGCPWDLDQDFDSIKPCTIEEAYEVADAIDRGDWNDLESELGDLLLQTVYHSQIGAERQLFDLASVAGRICDKMIERHPHVFGPNRPDLSSLQQERHWEDLKARERAASSLAGALSGVALALPSLTRAAKLQKRAAREGFDWDGWSGVMAKIDEELRELTDAAHREDPVAIGEEMGDLLFTCVNLARHLGLDPEDTLRAANSKFVRRFEWMERAIGEVGLAMAELGPDELDAYWAASKRQGEGRPDRQSDLPAGK